MRRVPLSHTSRSVATRVTPTYRVAQIPRATPPPRVAHIPRTDYSTLLQRMKERILPKPVPTPSLSQKHAPASSSAQTSNDAAGYMVGGMVLGHMMTSNHPSPSEESKHHPVFINMDNTDTKPVFSYDSSSSDRGGSSDYADGGSSDYADGGVSDCGGGGSCDGGGGGGCD